MVMKDWTETFFPCQHVQDVVGLVFADDVYVVHSAAILVGILKRHNRQSVYGWV